MPIYEHECRACGHRFERFVRPSPTAPDEMVVCPACRGDDLRRVPSLFGVSSDGTRALHLKQARKLAAPGLRDKKQAEIDAINHHDD